MKSFASANYHNNIQFARYSHREWNLYSLSMSNPLLRTNHLTFWTI